MNISTLHAARAQVERRADCREQRRDLDHAPGYARDRHQTQRYRPRPGIRQEGRVGHDRTHEEVLCIIAKPDQVLYFNQKGEVRYQKVPKILDEYVRIRHEQEVVS